MSGALLDPTTPNAARCYDVLLGGPQGFDADREMVARLKAAFPPGVPGPAELAAANRTYLELAVRDAVRAGIGQVLDLGAGFPAPRPLHEVARDVCPDARVAYLDIDERVVNHGAATVKGIPGVTYAHGDLGKPGDVMACPDVRAVIDPALPVVAIFGLTLHFVRASDARRIIEGWADWLPARSRFVVTVAHWIDVALWERVREAYGPAPLFNHSRREVCDMFRTLDLLGCGVERARGWGPEALGAGGPAGGAGGGGAEVVAPARTLAAYRRNKDSTTRQVAVK